jgi:hypothetical protein
VNISCKIAGSFLFGLILTGAVARPAAAQSAEASPVTLDVGYQYLHASAAGASLSYPGGFDVAVAGTVAGPWSIVGDIGWGRHSNAGLGTNTDAIAYGAGLRWSGASVAHAKLYAQMLVGGETDAVTYQAAAVNVMLQPGVGVAAPLGRVGVYAQVDYRRVWTAPAQNDVRVVAGIRLPLSR